MLFIKHPELDALPKPQFCDCCCSLNVELIDNKVIYGVSKTEWPFIWYCWDCKALVRCHPGTELPLGKMADSETRLLRVMAHKAFDPIWKTGILTRNGAYKWLKEALNIEHTAHISWLTKAQLETVIAVSVEYFNERKYIAERRSKKRNERNHKQQKRLQQQIRTRKLLKP